VPRPITGSIGSRIRLIFGDTGNDWLLIIDKDNGDRRWQDQDWRNIPYAVAKQINNCVDKGRDIIDVDFGPGGAWFVKGRKPDGTGGYSWWGGTTASDSLKEGTDGKVSFGTDVYGEGNYFILKGRNGYSHNNVNTHLSDRIKRMNSQNKTVNFVRLFGGSQYYISDETGKEWVIDGSYCSETVKKHNDVKEVAIAGDGSWVVICNDKYFSSTGVDEELDSALSKFFSDQRMWRNNRNREIREARSRIEIEEREA
jgi:hypothetical protein